MALIPNSDTADALSEAAHLAEVMKLLDSADSKNLLSVIESADADLGAILAKEMFSFKDLVKLTQDAMQRRSQLVGNITNKLAFGFVQSHFPSDVLHRQSNPLNCFPRLV